MNIEQLLARELEEALPLQREEGRNWDDVLQRAGFRRRRPRRLVAIAALVVLLGVAPAYAVAPRLIGYFDGPELPVPATVETSFGEHVMAESSFCWSESKPDGRSSVLCGLGREASCGDGETPTVEAARGEEVRFVLGFTPSEVGLVFPGRPSTENVALEPRRTVIWRADRSGVVTLWARGAEGSASYVACLALH